MTLIKSTAHLGRYVMTLAERINGELQQEELIFHCEAEDFAHAVEQCKTAYQGCVVNHIASHGEDWFVASGECETVFWDEDNISGFTIRFEDDESQHRGNEITDLTFKVEEWREGDIVDVFYSNTYSEIRNWINQEHKAHAQWRFTKQHLESLLDEASEATINAQGTLADWFLFFPPGSLKTDVMQWLQAMIDEPEPAAS